MHNILKSIGAVLAGLFGVVILSFCTDYLLQAIGLLPPPSIESRYVTWVLLLTLSYRIAYTVLGGYVTAWLAPNNPMMHVWILAGITLLGGILGVMTTLSGWTEQPLWYSLVIAISTVMAVWLGGWLRQSQTRK